MRGRLPHVEEAVFQPPDHNGTESDVDKTSGEHGSDDKLGIGVHIVSPNWGLR